MSDQSPDPGRSPGPLRFAGLGVQMAAVLLVSVLAGQWLDRRFQTGGILTIVAAFVGFAGVMIQLIRDLSGGGGKGK